MVMLGPYRLRTMWVARLAEHDRGQGEMQLVEQPGAKILTHRLDATADLHVATIGGLLRLIQRRLDTVGLKVVPPPISIGSRGWCVSTKVGA
jgi:hypothetical protein